MDLGYRNLLAPDGRSLIPPGDFRSPQLPRPPPIVNDLHRSPETGQMNKIPPVTGKRRGGCRKACNECKQQKVWEVVRPMAVLIEPFRESMHRLDATGLADILLHLPLAC